MTYALYLSSPSSPNDRNALVAYHVREEEVKEDKMTDQDGQEKDQGAEGKGQTLTQAGECLGELLLLDPQGSVVKEMEGLLTSSHTSQRTLALGILRAALLSWSATPAVGSRGGGFPEMKSVVSGEKDDQVHRSLIRRRDMAITHLLRNQLGHVINQANVLIRKDEEKEEAEEAEVGSNEGKEARRVERSGIFSLFHVAAHKDPSLLLCPSNEQDLSGMTGGKRGPQPSSVGLAQRSQRRASLISALVQELQVRNNLVRVIDMGPFKYKVDDGLESRKFAYETIYTLLNGLNGGGLCPEEVEDLVGRTMEHVVSGGFKDDGEGIPPILYLLIVRCARQAPRVVDGYVDRLVPGYRGLFERKLPTSAVKQQVEKHREQVQAAVRSLATLSTCVSFGKVS